MRIGINTGEVVAGDEQRRRSSTGDAGERREAARSRLRQPGEILIGTARARSSRTP